MFIGGMRLKYHYLSQKKLVLSSVFDNLYFVQKIAADFTDGLW